MENENDRLICINCNSEFECGAKTHDCWCTKLPKIMPVVGDSCWCPKCLMEKIADQEKSGNKG